MENTKQKPQQSSKRKSQTKHQHVSFIEFHPLLWFIKPFKITEESQHAEIDGSVAKLHKIKFLCFTFVSTKTIFKEKRIQTAADAFLGGEIDSLVARSELIKKLCRSGGDCDCEQRSKTMFDTATLLQEIREKMAKENLI